MQAVYNVNTRGRRSGWVCPPPSYMLKTKGVTTFIFGQWVGAPPTFNLLSLKELGSKVGAFAGVRVNKHLNINYSAQPILFTLKNG